MMEHALSLVVLGAIGLATWLLPKYLERRVAEAARGAVDVSVGKKLGEHRHTLDKQLEEYRVGLSTQIEQLRHSLAGERERSSKDYGLFAERRNVVYAETYALFEKARGGFAGHFNPILIKANFSRSPEADLKNVANKLERISEGERESLKGAITMHKWGEARELANVLYERDGLRRANDAFNEFQRAAVVHALYFSTAVDDVLVEASQALATLSVYADELIKEGSESMTFEDRKDRSENMSTLRSISARLREAMRKEMMPVATDQLSSEPR